MKTRYDTKATGHQFKEGDKVWFYNPTRRKGLSPKLQSHWDGPYTILKIINDVVNRIRHKVTVNGDRYRAMITNFFIPEWNNLDVQKLRFQPDGATCHTARATIDLFKDTFGDRLISRFGPENWPPRSCDLTPLD
ncbi:uncharacterized protein TNCV_333491 [Trichonephila clavipes]|nr:uncharacterized protein TNCV_333491 [Trichonephila clavipes]